MTIEKPEIPSYSLRTRINEIIFCLSLDAAAKKKAEQLKCYRTEYFLNLYDFSYGVSKYDNDIGVSSDPAFIAIEIASAKANYEKQIRRFEARYFRFHTILNFLPIEEQEIVRNTFFTQNSKDVRELNFIIKKHYREIEQFYPDDEEELSFEGEEGAILLGITKEKRLRRIKQSKSVLKELC